MDLYVDDLTSGGEAVNQEAETSASECDTADCVQRRLGLVACGYKFGKWDLGGERIFWGSEATHLKENTETRLRAEACMHTVKPLTIEKVRRANPEDR